MIYHTTFYPLVNQRFVRTDDFAQFSQSRYACFGSYFLICPILFRNFTFIPLFPHAGERQEEAAQAFLDYLQTADAMSVFESVGFSPAN